MMCYFLFVYIIVELLQKIPCKWIFAFETFSYIMTNLFIILVSCPKTNVIFASYFIQSIDQLYTSNYYIFVTLQ